MWLTDICVKRPIFTAMMTLALVVLGVFSYMQLGLDLMPKVDFPIVLVNTTLAGANPEEIETEVTKPIEEAINTISGIDELRSSSFEGLSQVVVKFVLEKDSAEAAQEVRDKIGRILGDLPEGTDPPVVQKFDPDSFPVFNLVVSAPMSPRDLTLLVRKKIKEPLETVNGVGSAKIIGGREREIHVEVDPIRLEAYGISILDVRKALQGQNLEVPGGRIDDDSREVSVRMMGRIQTPADFGNIGINNAKGVPVKISDIAEIKDTEQERRSLSRYDGRTAITLVIQKQSGTNTVEVAHRILAKLEDIKQLLPEGLKIEVGRDLSVFIVEAVNELKMHLFLGGFLASIVVFLFIRSWRTLVICAIAIPTSIIVTFGFMRYMGFTLNNMTLLAMSLATGIVIDDAIIVLENIYRHLEEKAETPFEAAVNATKEIGLAVFATTTSLIIIFVPLAFMRGMVGRFMYSYGLTVAFAVAVSLFVSFTLTPMMSSRMLKKDRNKKSSRENRVNKFTDKYYHKMLEWALSHRKATVAAAVLIVLSSIPTLMLIGKDFLPEDDRGEFQIAIRAPEGTSIEKMDGLLSDLEARVSKMPGVKHILASVGETEGLGVNNASIYVKLAPLDERDFSQFDTMNDARKMLASFITLRTSVQPVSERGGGGMRASQFNFAVRGPDIKKLGHYANEFKKALSNTPGLIDVDTSLDLGKPEARIEIDRQRAADLDVQVGELASAVRLFVSGEEDITKYKEGDELYEVRIKLKDDYRKAAEDLLALPVHTGKEGMPSKVVRLDSVASIVETTGPANIDRYDRERQVTVDANLDDKPIGYAIGVAKGLAAKMKMPPEYNIVFSGMAKIFKEMIGNFLIAFGLSFLFVYMILASQFESLLHPITIMIALPLSLPFAFISLLAADKSLNIYSMLGLFMLFGIVKKNSILQIDYTNTLRRQGMNRHEALVTACRTRLRPILMTTITLVAGMMPVALGTGAGSGTRSSLAVVIIGGQTLCLLITLLITPVAYSLFDDIQTIHWPRLIRGLARPWHRPP